MSVKPSKIKKAEKMLNAHVEYLTRLLKTAPEYSYEKFVTNFAEWRDNAVCHEIAINSEFGLSVETHCNPLGQEDKYSKIISDRNGRVKLLWDMLNEVVSQNPSLNNIQPYDLSDLGQFIACPVCGETVGEINSYGHFEWDAENQCKCIWFSPAGELHEDQTKALSTVVTQALETKAIFFEYTGQSVLPSKYSESVRKLINYYVDQQEKFMNDCMFEEDYDEDY